MTLKEFILKMMEIPEDAKVIPNVADCTEQEIRLFLLKDAPTAKEVMKQYFENKNCIFLNGRVTFNRYMPMLSKVHGPEGWSAEVTDVVYHDAHYKKDRFYEIKTQTTL